MFVILAPLDKAAVLVSCLRSIFDDLFSAELGISYAESTISHQRRLKETSPVGLLAREGLEEALCSSRPLKKARCSALDRVTEQ